MVETGGEQSLSCIPTSDLSPEYLKFPPIRLKRFFKNLNEYDEKLTGQSSVEENRTELMVQKEDYTHSFLHDFKCSSMRQETERNGDNSLGTLR